MEHGSLRSWLSALMMIFCILAVCILVPMGFVSAGRFVTWLESVGVHISPNLSGGYPVAEFTEFQSSLQEVPRGMDLSEVRKALSLTRFSVRKVAFRRFSGMGIAPRLNLCLEFDGPLPDPQNSPNHFSMTTVHVYLKTPGGKTGSMYSERTAKVQFENPGWNYQVIIDGFHEQARIYDAEGNLKALGVGLYVDRKAAARKDPREAGNPAADRTVLTAALPMNYLGDPARGDWQFYVLVGLSDSRDPSMMLHSSTGARPLAYCASLAVDRHADTAEKPWLRPLVVRNPL